MSVPADRRPLEHPGESVLTTGGPLGAPGLVSIPVAPTTTIRTDALWRDRDDLMAVLPGGGQRVV